MSLRCLHFFKELQCAYTAFGLPSIEGFVILISCVIQGVKEIVLTTSTLKVTCVSANHFASFTLRELSHVDPYLITLAEFAVV